MRQYLIDEISKRDIEKIRKYLDEHAYSSDIDDIYWVFLDDEQLSIAQREHEKCKPHFFSIEVGKDFVKFEFLIRSRNSMRCKCIDYATPFQRDFILHFCDKMIATLGIRT